MAADVDPITIEIVQGTLASIEAEVEEAIARTARSPMIRDAHDFRAGIHDRRLRKLTGRSYSSLVHPIVRDFPTAQMRPGDVYFHNDVYTSEGGIGHLPDLCVTVPVFAPDADIRRSEVVAFVQAFGHHDDIGGAVPGSMPSDATEVFAEGLMVPPIKLWDAGVPNEAALRIMTRNSRMPDHLAGDLDAEASACAMGARRLSDLFTRYGTATVEACFDAIIDRTTETFRREVLARIPEGTFVWEDYAEHDGVDPPRLHGQRITLTRDRVRASDSEPVGGDPGVRASDSEPVGGDPGVRASDGEPGDGDPGVRASDGEPGDGDPGVRASDGEPGDGELVDRIVIDFTGTSPQAKGPINHAGDYADGNFLKKWLAPILRNLAETPERMAELDVNEGVVPLIEMRFPDKGTLLTPIFPAPTNARTFVILRLLGVLAGVLAKATGGRMPADQETIRYTGVFGTDAHDRPYLMREVLGGGSGGRWYADGEDTIHIVPDSRNIPVEFVESRHPLRVERLGLATDSGGPGEHRGGLGYDKWIRVLRDASYMSIADRSILSCWGVNGGRAGMPFRATIAPGGPNEREMEGLTLAEPMTAGEVVRIRTTGGGGWGDPLARDPDAVLRDVRDGKVSMRAAAHDYGVVLRPVEDPAPDTMVIAATEATSVALAVDREATTARRADLHAHRGEGAFFDRGPGYAQLANGAGHAPFDTLSDDESRALRRHADRVAAP